MKKTITLALVAFALALTAAIPALANGESVTNAWLDPDVGQQVRAFGSVIQTEAHPKLRVTVTLQVCKDGFGYCDANISGVWDDVTTDVKTCNDGNETYCQDHTIFADNGAGCGNNPWYWRSKAKGEAYGAQLGWHAVDRYTSPMQDFAC